jgi:hypothetical protein
MSSSLLTPVAVAAAAVFVASVGVIDQQPSVLAETKAWLEGEGLTLMHSVTSRTDRTTGLRQTTDARITTLTLNDCRLAWQTMAEITTTLGDGERRAQSVVDVTVPLNDLDLRGIQVHTVPSLNGDATIAVSMETRVAAGATVAYASQGGPTSWITEAGILVQTAADGDRLAAAIRTAATLCGAVSSR